MLFPNRDRLLGLDIISRNVPPTWPTWELNRDVTLKCEHYGFDFALSMVKFRGFGGETEYWDYSLDSFTLAAALAPITSRIKLIPSVTNLSLHPAVAARMASTIEAICPGRFGLNIVSGWYKDEFQQMGLWPGDQHFESRYDYATEYVRVLRDLWDDGHSNFKGRYFQLNDAEIKPKPSTFIPLVCAGQSARGIRFTAECGERNFIIAGGNVNDFDHSVAGADQAARRNLVGQAELDKSEGMFESLKRKSMFMGLPTLVGGHATVANYLDRLHHEAKLQACVFAFPDFEHDIDDFMSNVHPRMQARGAAP